MKVLVFGANGKVGRLVVAKALSRGHDVTAFVHSNRSSLPSHVSLKVIVGDVFDSEAVANAVAGADAVISALGSWGAADKRVLSVGITHIISAMKLHRVKRIVSVTGSDARYELDERGLIHTLLRPLLIIFAGKILRDGEAHLASLHRSKLNWTAVRSPVMTNGHGLYRLTNKRPNPWSAVYRDSVAEALIDCVEHNTYVQQSPFIVKA